MLHLMGAGDSAAGFLGCKAYASSKDGVYFFVLLFDAETARPLATIEADYLGQVRTAAASGLATKCMARDDARTLAIVGSGLQAFTQVLAVDCARKLAEVRVFSRDAARRADFASRLRDHVNAEIRTCESARDTVRGADIVVTATSSTHPVFLGEWIEPGMHINAIGGNAASRRELDEAAVDRAERIVVDSIEQSKIESGELITAFRPDARRWEEVIELRDVVAGKKPGRATAQEVTLFKSNGVALEDIALAGWLYKHAAK